MHGIRYKVHLCFPEGKSENCTMVHVTKRFDDLQLVDPEQIKMENTYKPLQGWAQIKKLQFYKIIFQFFKKI